MDDICASLGGETLFSVIDLRHAYLQMEVEEHFRPFLTIDTTRGLYQYQRLPYGVASAPAIWQRAMDQTLQEIQGVFCYLDDIIVTGSTMQEHLYYLHSLRKIRRYLSQDCLVTLIDAFVTSRPDYCNSLMYGLLQCQISKLQRVQNAAAHIALDLSKFCHINPTLRQLHWLPVVKRIQFKMLLLTFKAIHGLSPPYISELITVKPKSTHGLRSNNSTLLQLPPTQKMLPTLGTRSFAVAAAPAL